ncbi:hypothetical protein DSECCO2_173700 [anaerobic digester metagenome]
MDKTLLRHFRLVVVAKGKAGPAYPQFARHACGQLAPLGIADGKRHVGDGAAHANGLRLKGRNFLHCRADAGFRRAVGVEITQALGIVQGIAHHRRLARRYEHAQSGKGLSLKKIEVRGRQGDNADVVIDHVLPQRPGGVAALVAHRIQGGPCQQSHEHFRQRGVKNGRRKLQHMVIGLHAKKLDLPLDHVGKAAVRSQHALGLACGAGGVDQVGPILCPGCLRQGTYGGLAVGKIGKVKRDVCPGVFHNIGHAVGCGLGVYGQIDRAKPLYAQNNFGQIGRALRRHSHNAAPCNALPCQPRGATQGIFAHLRVRKGVAPFVPDGNAPGKGIRRRVKKFGQGTDIILSGRAAAPLREFPLFFFQQIIKLRRLNASGKLGHHALNAGDKTLHIPVAQVVAAVAHRERKAARAQLLHDQGTEKDRLLGAVPLLRLDNREFWRAGRCIGQKIDKGICQKGKIFAFKLAGSQLVRRAHMAVKGSVLGADGLQQPCKGIVRGHVYQQWRQRHHGPLPPVQHLALPIGHWGKSHNVLFSAHERHDECVDACKKHRRADLVGGNERGRFTRGFF